MPTIWGYGSYGTEPGTMPGWGYMSDGAAVVSLGIFSAQELLTSYRDREIESSYNAAEKPTTYKARSDEE